MLIARRTLADPGASFWTSLRYFCVTRLVIAAVLLGASLYGGERISVGAQDPALFARTAVTYAVLAATFGALLVGRAVRGWRGRLALSWTLGGFAMLFLAYAGSRFVLEVVLHRV